MKTFLIGYDLNKAGQDYTNLIDAIKAESTGSWWHNLDSTWLIIVTDAKTVESVSNSLGQHIDNNDELLVIDVTGRARGWIGFSEKASDWLTKTYV